MAQRTRRSFLQDTSVTAAAFSLLPGIPALAAIHHSPQAAAPPSPAPPTGSMVIHVNDVATGEMTLLVGKREIALRDPQLVARFLEAAR